MLFFLNLVLQPLKIFFDIPRFHGTIVNSFFCSIFY